MQRFETAAEHARSTGCGESAAAATAAQRTTKERSVFFRYDTNPCIACSRKERNRERRREVQRSLRRHHISLCVALSHISSLTVPSFYLFAGICLSSTPLLSTRDISFSTKVHNQIMSCFFSSLSLSYSPEQQSNIDTYPKRALMLNLSNASYHLAYFLP